MSSEVKVNKISPASGTSIVIGNSGDTVSLGSGVSASGFGKVLQVVQGIKSNTFSTTSASFTEITGLSVSITPSNASNNVLIIYSVAFGVNNHNHHQLRRDGVEIAPLNTDSGYYSGWSCGELEVNNMTMTNVAYLDSPSSTSSLTYSVYCRSRNSSFTTAVNRTVSDTASQDLSIRGASYIIAMEIEG